MSLFTYTILVLLTPNRLANSLCVSSPGVDALLCSAVGYVYLVFENEKSVRALLQACTQDLLHPEENGEYYFKMSSRRMRCKDVSGGACVS